MPVDILLANSFYLAFDRVERKIMEPYFPLGILYIASVLRREGYSLALYDGCFATRVEDFEAALKRHRPKVVGINALNTTRKAAMAMGRMARSRDIPVVFGGADPTSRPEGYLTCQDGLERPGDVVVMAEGEETIVDVMAALLGTPSPSILRAIRGIAFADDGQAGRPVTNSSRPAIQDVDALPYPAWDLVDLERYRRVWLQQHDYFSMSLITSRGCPFGCNWCAKPVFGRAYRARSPQSAVAEQRWLRDTFSPDRIQIVDDIFGLNKKWLSEWHQQALAAEAQLPFECLSRVDLVNPTVLQQLKEVGCRKIFFGAESGSQGVLDAMNKGIQVEQTLEAARGMRDVGIQTHFYIMVGYPGEEPSDIAQTIRMVKEALPDTFSVSVAYPLPGTEFYDRMKDLLLPEHDWAYSSENLLLFQREKYSSLFYRWVERLLNKEWALERVRTGRDHFGLGTLKLAGELLVCRAAVGLLGKLQSRSWPFFLADAPQRPGA